MHTCFYVCICLLFEAMNYCYSLANDRSFTNSLYTLGISMFTYNVLLQRLSGVSFDKLGKAVVRLKAVFVGLQDDPDEEVRNNNSSR